LGRTQSQFRCAGGEKSHAHAHGKNWTLATHPEASKFSAHH
jgi:hypothetical protein